MGTVTKVKIATAIGLFVLWIVMFTLMSSCGGDPDYDPYKNASKIGETIVMETSGDVLEMHRINSEGLGFADPFDVVRVFDTELCLVFYITNTGVGAPIQMADIREGTNTYLELADYCQGSFK